LSLDLPQVDNPWEHKISVDMHRVATTQTELLNPTISFIFPRIERGRRQPIVRDVSDPKDLTKRLFDSASEKIRGTLLLYESIPTKSFDSEELAVARLETMSELVSGSKWDIKGAKTTIAEPKSCMEKIDL
jgi:hypothetical protein